MKTALTSLAITAAVTIAAIAVALVGSNFAGLSGAALTSAWKKNTILQSAKLMVSVREIFLNDEHDLAYSNTIYEQYVQNIMEIE